MFGRFLEHRYDGLDDQAKQAFERLIEIQDPVIMDWLFGKSASEDSQLQSIIHSLQELSGLNA